MFVFLYSPICFLATASVALFVLLFRVVTVVFIGLYVSASFFMVLISRLFDLCVLLCICLSVSLCIGFVTPYGVYF